MDISFKAIMKARKETYRIDSEGSDKADVEASEYLKRYLCFSRVNENSTEAGHGFGATHMKSNIVHLQRTLTDYCT